MSDRFEFVKSYNFILYKKCILAEQYIESDPDSAQNKSRSALEGLLHDMYSGFYEKESGYNMVNYVEQNLITNRRIIKLMKDIYLYGSKGSHGNGNSYDARYTVDCLEKLFKWYVCEYHGHNTSVESFETDSAPSAAPLSQSMANKLKDYSETKRIEEATIALEKRQKELKVQQERIAAQERLARMEEVRRQEQQRVLETMRKQEEQKAAQELSRYQEEIRALQEKIALMETEQTQCLKSSYKISTSKKSALIDKKPKAVYLQCETSRKLLDEIDYYFDEESYRRLNISEETYSKDVRNLLEKKNTVSLIQRQYNIEYVSEKDMSVIIESAEDYYGGYPKDNRAYQLFKEVSKLDSARFENFVGLCYETGFGVRQNLENANKWYTWSANKNNVTSEKGKSRTEEALQQIEYEEFLSNPYPDSKTLSTMSAVASLYGCGYGSYPKNPEKCITLLKKAALYSPSAAIDLADHYLNGIYVKVDYFEALKWYKKAKENARAVRGLDYTDKAEDRIRAVLFKIDGSISCDYKQSKYY